MKKITVFVLTLALVCSGAGLAADRLFPSEAEGQRLSNYVLTPTISTPQKKKSFVSQKKKRATKNAMSPALDYSEFNDESDVFTVEIKP